ncbi:hypothetical protein BG842_14875 [Haladaptatus sp. W1]|nr:hypothetical protein BG842_14875 [Haladaptatus sp. W1]
MFVVRLPDGHVAERRPVRVADSDNEANTGGGPLAEIESFPPGFRLAIGTNVEDGIAGFGRIVLKASESRTRLVAGGYSFRGPVVGESSVMKRT